MVDCSQRQWAVVVVLVTACIQTACGGAGAAMGPALSPVTAPAVWAGEEVVTGMADLPELRALLAESEADEVTVTYLSAELDLLEGQMGRAFERFAEVADADLEGLLGAVSMSRMVGLSRLVPDYPERVAELLEPLHGRVLPPLPAYYVNLLAVTASEQLHERINGGPAGRFSADALGVPDEWRYAGPFGRLPRLHLEQAEPFDHDLVLDTGYGPDGRVIETREWVASDASLSVPASTPGVYVFETWAHLDATSTRLMILEARMGAQLSIDDRVVLVRREVGDYSPDVLVRPVRLAAGWHRLRLRLGVSGSADPVRARLAPLAANEPGITFHRRPPEGVVLAEVAPGPFEPAPLAAMLPDSLQPPHSALAALALLSLGNDFGDERLGDLGLAYFEERGPLVSVWEARLAGARSSAAPSERHNLRLQALRRALETAPSAGAVTLALSSELASDGRGDEALRLARSLDDRLVQEPSYHLTLADLYQDRGWEELAEAELEEALELSPRVCGAVKQLVDLYTFREHTPPVEELPEGFRTCQAGILYQIEQHLLPQGHIDEAIERLGRLAQHDPTNSTVQRRLINLLIREGRDREAREQLERASTFALSTADRVGIEVDWLLAQGRREEASNRLEAGLDRRPGDYALNQTAARLADHEILSDLRIDTASAIAAYRERQAEPRAGVVYALDYAAYRYYEDGSALSVTHQILHVLTREALGTYGEASVPENSLLLRARTIKADGTILEPDNIPGKPGISLPNLEVGDFVETEYLEVVGPSRVHADTVVGLRFYFRVFDAPLSRSELLVEVPAEWSELTLDLRAGAPEPQIEELGEVRRYRFVVYDSPPPVEEPAAPDYSELLPSVRYAHAYTWEDARDYYVDRRLAVARVTPEIEALAERLTADADGPEEAVRRIFRTVVDEFEEQGGFLSVDAQWTLRLGEGERLPLLLALLEAAGFEPRLVFLRSWEDDQVTSPVPDPDDFPHTAVWIGLDDGESVWLDPSLDYAPFDYLPAAVQGSDGFVIGTTSEGPTQWVQAPEWPDDTLRHRIELTLRIDEAGDFTAQAVEQVPLGNAPWTRSYLEQIQDQRSLFQDLEGALSASFSGVEVESCEAEAAAEADVPLTLRYSFRGRALAAITDGQLRVDARIFDRNLRSTLGSQARRSFPLSIGFPFSEEVTLRFVLPEGYRLSQTPEEVEDGFGPLMYRRSVTAGGAGEPTITLVRRTDLEVGRVSPEAYPDFLEVLSRVDRAETLHLAAER